MVSENNRNMNLLIFFESTTTLISKTFFPSLDVISYFRKIEGLNFHNM